MQPFTSDCIFVWGFVRYNMALRILGLEPAARVHTPAPPLGLWASHHALLCLRSSTCFLGLSSG